MSGPEYLSRGIDYLGDLGAKLRDLRGYRTLAHELIQNADDAKGTASMSFDVGDNALVIDNDGVFSDCQHIRDAECPWKEDGAHGHRCDFHRFRKIFAGDKRGEPDTTGAFGIGFIAVYQVTDCPELISAGRHWILHEEEDESRRIEVCPGCVKCAPPGLPGTRFVLPWARNAVSELRQRLQAESVPDDGPSRILEELKQTLPVAMLFLKRLRTVAIKQAGRPVRSFQRVDHDDSLIVTDGNPQNDQIWHVMRGDFANAAEVLRARHPDRIEKKRSSQVTIAMPAGAFSGGLFCACVPTEQRVGLPFHVNADFFTTNDRKSVILSDDYQSEWNREALRAASLALERAIGKLPALLGARRFWGLVSALKEVADAAERGSGDRTLAGFWKVAEPRLRMAPTIYTTDKRWTTCADATLLVQREESGVIPALEGLGMNVVHEDLRPYQGLLRSEAVGVPALNIERLCVALKAQGLNDRTELSALPASLKSPSNLAGLWQEISLLLDRQQRTPKAKADDERRLREIALAPGRDNALWPFGDVFSSDRATVDLFESLKLSIPFLSSVGGFSPLIGLCPQFDAAAAVDALGAVETGQLEEEWQQKRLPLRRLFEWFENRRQPILDDDDSRERLAALSLYPSSGKLRSLNELALPGHFADHLGLADLVDLDALGGCQQFLRDLGMPELDFRTYAVARLPGALNDSATPAEKRRAAVQLLSSRAGELKDDQAARQALATTRLVECSDEEFRQANECYFDERAVRECLGNDARFATLPKGHEAALRELYAWLGVRSEPDFRDVARAIRVVSDQQYSPDGVARIQSIVAHLGRRVAAGEDPSELKGLATAKWLPVQGKSDRWYGPAEVHAVFSKHLFESQALFLDVPRGVQDSSVDFLKFLGVSVTPAVVLVVKHLIHSAARNVPVNREVYRFLDNNAADLTIGQLQSQKCLWLGDAYYAPTQVFWADHSFGSYRRRLHEDLRGYNNFLKRLGVRETPDHHDANNVLMEISAKFGAANAPLDDGAHAVAMTCWQMLDRALESGTISISDLDALRLVKCVPNALRLLIRPEWMFFENRPGLAAKFGEFLVQNVIPRPVGAGYAFSAAGVRELGSAVEVALLECADPVDDAEMASKILGRRNEIGRVLVSQSFGSVSEEALRRLGSIRCAATTSLVIRYRLRAFNRELQSEPEMVPALYHQEDETLFFMRTDGRTPWGAVAREVAIALFADQDPGRFAAGFKEVLAPDSVAEAAANLDELGFARLDSDAHVVPVAGQTAGALGIEETSGVAAEKEIIEAPQGQGDADSLTPSQALERLLGSDAPPPTPPVPELGMELTEAGQGKGSAKHSRPTKKAGRPVLRSYLPPPNADQKPENQGQEQGRSPVDKAGVGHVLEYERTCDRIPKEMPHNNTGYDIESRDTTGVVVRWIEVKSLSGQWNSTYAVLSRSQFEKATVLGESFWLYVVEQAESDKYQIHRIPNPALKANHFMFDDGWRATAEPAAS